MKEKKRRGRKLSETSLRIKDYLDLHPEAAGNEGLKNYNNDELFGKKHGKVTYAQFNNTRCRFRKELKLPDVRTLNAKKRREEKKSRKKYERSKVIAKPEPFNAGGYLDTNTDEKGVVISIPRGDTSTEVSPVPRRRRKAFTSTDDGPIDHTEKSYIIPPKRAGERVVRGAFKSDYDFLERSGIVIRPEDLVKAITYSIDRITENEVQETAKNIMHFFGYQLRIIDNVLEPDDRDVFNMLEDAGLLSTEREETTLYDGREWRIHYWILRTDRILPASKKQEENEKKQKEEDPLKDVPEEAWAEHAMNGIKKE